MAFFGFVSVGWFQLSCIDSRRGGKRGWSQMLLLELVIYTCIPIFSYSCIKLTMRNLHLNLIFCPRPTVVPPTATGALRWENVQCYSMQLEKYKLCVYFDMFWCFLFAFVWYLYLHPQWVVVHTYHSAPLIGLPHCITTEQLWWRRWWWGGGWW